MALVIGAHLGQYEIVSALGAGGMGEVYRARDTKLGRSVAIKVLPEEVLSDPDRIARFEREAKVLAALNHPNIAALFGMEEADPSALREPQGRLRQGPGTAGSGQAAVRFLIMELVEGPTLEERLEAHRSGLPLGATLEIARQIAEALEAAHEKGIVHRDLKPANVKVSEDNKVKVLDFGLARAMDPKSGADAGFQDPTYKNSPTLSAVATQAGVILGTAAYMSPEQAKGLPADHRSDIFSFGVVLHEMLTGRQPFQGETAAEIMASVLVRDADLSGLPTDLNPRLIELLRRCLEKNPKKRWQAIGDVNAELEAIAGAPRSVTSTAFAAALPRPLWRRAIPIGMASLIVGTLGATGAWFLKPSARSDVTRFSFALGEGQQFTNPGRHLVAIAPDGTKLVYVADSRLYVRALSELEAKPIPGTNEPGAPPINPVFSPDGQSIAFFASGFIKRIAVSGGAAVTICPAENPLGMSWDRDTILFGQIKGIMRVSANGGMPDVVASVKDGELAHGPQMLPDEQNVMFTLASGGGTTRWDSAQIVVQSITSGERKTLIEGGSDARYVPTGHVVYALAGTEFAIPFDVRRLEVRGGPVPVVEGVRRANANQTGAAHLSFSATGSLVYVPGPISTSGGDRILAVADRSGVVTPLKVPAGSYQHARVAPDGKRVAFSLDSAKEINVWVYDLDEATSMRRLTFGGNNQFPVWTADGQRLAFQSDREKDLAIFWQRADTSGLAERLTKPDVGVSHIPESWSPDGERFLYTDFKTPSATLWTFSVRDSKAERFDAVSSSNPLGSMFSPDGRWVTYYTNESAGRSSVFVQAFPPTGEQYFVSAGEAASAGARHPIWSPTGKELFFNTSGLNLSFVAVQPQPTFTIGNAVAVSADGSFTATNVQLPRNHDIFPDGKRFITIVPAVQSQTGTADAQEIRVVLNWFEELKQRVPSR